ncbi:rod shape-determining protein MreC [Rhodanobacter sp. FW510-R12]|uniref:rod shape-determining protein MreC n=1 Tax=unclassified Rhodanobacter TaxID=2621553 RepID=UPI0007AA2537|nr:MULTISPECIES: rod shape-determining protein MreC [unclassified Rhodanobacter]KZC15513.1 rod shape-determining protein MreC [Rhodanobacter sp. FW104-R8]KZC26011.1 rod shape-determining protein MreC [Rhodanobacter sp. FW510-T8]KZC29740.1 rod shape-determining protein MreC [Rhodanobacter sp. FW510-R10]
MARTRDESSPLFAGNAAGTLRLIVYLALAVVLMVLDHRNGWLWRLRYATAAVVEPVYRLAGLPAAGIRAVSVTFADRQRLTEQNQRLREDLLLANAKLNRMAAVAEQNQRLKELLDTQHSLKLNVQLARVIGVDLGAYRYALTLNMGARDGVRPGQPVIDARGVMGQVKEVLPTTSMVMLITDPSHAIPVVIERTGLRTVAYGSRDGAQLSLPNIPQAADVRVGDKLLTSGLGGRFPPGFPVGEVRSVAPSASGMFLVAMARPSADLDRSEDVLLLHDQAEPDGPPAPVTPMGPPRDLAPAASASASASAPSAASGVRR